MISFTSNLDFPSHLFLKRRRAGRRLTSLLKNCPQSIQKIDKAISEFWSCRLGNFEAIEKGLRMRTRTNFTSRHCCAETEL